MALTAPILIPHYEKKEQNAINRLISEYRAGAQNLLPYVAELALIRDLIREIKTKANEHNEGEA